MEFDLMLIQKMKHGDEHAFDIFIRRYYEEILKYCSYHCPDSSYAEDLTQETFLRFFEKISDYRYLGKTKNYLYTIAGNLCRDYYKKVKESLMEKPEKEVKSDLQKSEAADILDRLMMEEALSNLSEELREVVILYYFQELKLAEIANVLQIGLPLVKYRIRQAKIQLRELLKKEEGYESGKSVKGL